MSGKKSLNSSLAGTRSNTQCLRTLTRRSSRPTVFSTQKPLECRKALPVRDIFLSILTESFEKNFSKQSTVSGFQGIALFPNFFQNWARKSQRRSTPRICNLHANEPTPRTFPGHD